MTEPEEKTENSTEAHRAGQKPSRFRYSRPDYESTDHDKQPNRMAREQTNSTASERNNLCHVGFQIVSRVPSKSTVSCIREFAHYLTYTPHSAMKLARPFFVAMPLTPD